MAGGPGGNRTPDQGLRRPLLYPPPPRLIYQGRARGEQGLFRGSIHISRLLLWFSMFPEVPEISHLFVLSEEEPSLPLKTNTAQRGRGRPSPR
jgi:hypothetical protein